MSAAEAHRGFWGHDPEAPLDLGTLSIEAVEDITARLADRSMTALSDTLAQVANCAHPVRLSGRSDTIDTTTGEVIESFRAEDQPLGLLFKPCGNRRADVCPACSRLYARDTFEVISTGLHGGKGVPETVAGNPLLFVTLTAPSFGPVHTVREKAGRRLPCHPRAKLRVCAHGRRTACWTRHDDTDPELGAPLCPDCYDTTSAAIWQWHAPELWRRFTIALRRAVSAALGVPDSRLREHARLEYAKVAEFQARGLVHFHALVRLDGPHGPGSPAPISAATLHAAVTGAAEATWCTAPPVDDKDTERVLRFGEQIDVKAVRDRLLSGEDTITAEQVAAYLAKYATKSTGADPATRKPHRVKLAQTCRDLAARNLAGCPDLCEYVAADRHPDLCAKCARKPYALLGHWSSMLGFRGHYSTKSRHYSVTLGALRRARHRYQRLTADALRNGRTLDTRDLEARLLADDDETTLVVGSWTYQGTGWPRAGDKALADAAAARAREYAQWKAQQAA